MVFCAQRAGAVCLGSFSFILKKVSLIRLTYRLNRYIIKIVKESATQEEKDMTKQQMKKANQMIDNMKTVEDFNNIMNEAIGVQPEI